MDTTGLPFGIGLVECFLLLIMSGVIVIPFWRIFTKAGYPGILSLLMMVPLVNLILLYFLAFVEWPSLRGRPYGLDR